MRKARGWAVLAVLGLVLPTARAQRPAPPPRVVPPPRSVVPPPGADRMARRTARMMERLRDELWSYRQELTFFGRTPEFRPLVDLRIRIRDLAVRVAGSDENDPRVHQAAREMDRAARELYRLTNLLEQRADLGARAEVRRRADALEERAVEIRVLIGRLQELVRLDPPGFPPGGPIPPGAPRGGPNPPDPRDVR